MVAVLLFNKHKQIQPISIRSISTHIIRVINLSYHSYLVVFSLSPFDVILTPLCLNLNFSYNVHAATSHHLHSRLLSYLNVFMFFASKSYLNIVKGKLFHPRDPKVKISLINSSNLHTKMRLWWTSWDYSPLDFSQANCGESVRTNYRITKLLKTLGP